METSKFHQKSALFGPLSYFFHRHYKDPFHSMDRLQRDRLGFAKDLFQKDMKGHFGCVNAIEFSPNGGELIASGGDDRRVLLWNAEAAICSNGSPQILKGEHHSNIFCLTFNNSSDRVFSGGNDEQVIVHDIVSGETQDVFTHEDAVYGLSMDPVSDSVFASACDDGRILIFDTRASPGEDPFVLANYPSPMHAVVYNPVEPRLLATANAKEGIGLWDIRKPRTALLRYGGTLMQQSCMSVRVSRCGTRLLALRRRLPPVLYNLQSSAALFQFDHPGYYNSCTMKSCCFAGDQDQYVVSGSDDFNLYMWKIPDKPPEVPWVSEAHLVLKGHRSIVNQVRFNPANHLLLSSGVEKVIKMWSPFHLPNSQGNLGDEPNNLEERPVYTHEEYINLVLSNGQVMSHDYTHQSTEEDPRMMAFFDSLVQRELEGWSSDDESLDSVSGILEPYVQPSNREISESEGSSHSDEENDAHWFTLACERAVASTLSEANGENNRPSLLDIDLGRNPGNQDSESQNGSSLPGQQASTSRRSITELITQKRKEYLASICRSERAKLKKRRTLTASSVVEEGSSSDSSDSSNIVVKKKKKRTRPRTSSSEVNSSQSEEEGRDISQRLCTSLQEKNLALKRLRKLRAHVLNSDSEEDVKDKCNNNGPSSENGVLGQNLNEQVLNIVNHGASSSQDNAKSDSEIGPLLPEAIINDCKPCGLNQNTNNGVASPLIKTSICVPSSTAVNNSGCSVNCNGSTTPANELEEHQNGSPNPSTSGGANNNHSNNSDSSQPTWEEFKRFKNRLERARRHYRRRSSQHDGQSSGNDT